MNSLKTHDIYIKYNLVEAFEYILNESEPRMNRAVRLYELQIAIMLGGKVLKHQLRKQDQRDNWIRVSRATLLAARMVSRTRLLEHLIHNNYPDVRKKVPFKKLVRDKEALGLLRQIIKPNKSRYIACSRSWRDLNKLLIEERKKQDTYASLYHVSLNFALHGGANWKCNWSRAASLLNFDDEDIEYRIARKYLPKLGSAYKVNKYKEKDNHFAVFIWLDHFGGGFISAIRPVTGLFAEKLLAKVDDTVGLRTYVAQYAYVRAQLARQDYPVPELEFTVPIPPQAVSFDHLPSELTETI